MTPEALELLRSLPDGWVPIDDYGEVFAAFVGGPWIDVDGEAIGRTPAGHTLLATIDQEVNRAVQAERERTNGYMKDFVTAASRDGFEIGFARGVDGDPSKAEFYEIVDLCVEGFEEAWTHIPLPDDAAVAQQTNPEASNG